MFGIRTDRLDCVYENTYFQRYHEKENVATAWRGWSPRKVWMFPIRPFHENDVKKMAMFVFKDIEDFKACGKDVDEQYMKMIIAKKKSGSKSAYVPPVISKPDPKPPVVIPDDIVGKQVRHKAFGIGTIIAIEETSIAVDFDKVGLKKMGYEF